MLLAQNEAGYRNLMRLVSALWLDPTDGDEAHVPFTALEDAQGLIALTGGPGGPIDRALRTGFGDLAESRLKRLAKIFGSRLYVEIQRHGLDAERAIEPELIALADRLGLPLVATNEPYFGGASDYEAHDALLCVAEGAVVSAHQRRRLTPEHRFKTRAQMAELFADLPEATRGQRRDRVALRLSAADAKTHSAALFGGERRRARRGAGAEAPGERGVERSPRRARPRAGTRA